MNKCYNFVAVLLLLCCCFVVAVYYTICNYLNKCYNFFIYFLLINQSVNLPYKKFIYALASNASKVLGLICLPFFHLFYLIYTMIYFWNCYNFKKFFLEGIFWNALPAVLNNIICCNFKNVTTLKIFFKGYIWERSLPFLIIVYVIMLKVLQLF